MQITFNEMKLHAMHKYVMNMNDKVNAVFVAIQLFSSKHTAPLKIIRFQLTLIEMNAFIQKSFRENESVSRQTHTPSSFWLCIITMLNLA